MLIIYLAAFVVFLLVKLLQHNILKFELRPKKNRCTVKTQIIICVYSSLLHTLSTTEEFTLLFFLVLVSLVFIIFSILKISQGV